MPCRQADLGQHPRPPLAGCVTLGRSHCFSGPPFLIPNLGVIRPTPLGSGGTVPAASPARRERGCTGGGSGWHCCASGVLTAWDGDSLVDGISHPQGEQYLLADDFVVSNGWLKRPGDGRAELPGQSRAAPGGTRRGCWDQLSRSRQAQGDSASRSQVTPNSRGAGTQQGPGQDPGGGWRGAGPAQVPLVLGVRGRDRSPPRTSQPGAELSRDPTGDRGRHSVTQSQALTPGTWQGHPQ